MARRFNLADILLVKKLQGQGAYLDLETALLWPPAPLWVALIDYFSLNEVRGSTFVVDHSSMAPPAQGFLQAWDRVENGACDVICIAPRLRGPAAASEVWYDLLEHLCLEMGERGMHRIFAGLPEDEEGIDVFRRLGFSAYARREIFRLEKLPPGCHPRRARLLRPLAKGEDSSLHRLRSSLTPRLVQQAEGEIGRERDIGGLLPWWKSCHIEDHVLAYGNEIRAYLRIVTGELGHWLRTILQPDAVQQADQVLSEALHLVSAYPARPVYCSVREYEPGVRGALGELGFQPFTSELLMVKQTTVRVGVPVPKLGAALEKQVETATSVSRSSSRREAL